MTEQRKNVRANEKGLSALSVSHTPRRSEVCHQPALGARETCALCGKSIDWDEYVVNWASCGHCFDASVERHRIEAENNRHGPRLVIEKEPGVFGASVSTTDAASRALVDDVGGIPVAKTALHRDLLR